jgi:hypothetical protein
VIEIKIDNGETQAKISGNPVVVAAEFSAAIGGISKSISDAFDEKMPGKLSFPLKLQMVQYLMKAAHSVLGAPTEEATENNGFKISAGDRDELLRQLANLKAKTDGEGADGD